ncbi:hypothetical protein N8I74_06570 [Chitiniphilus purpureus]|uniref:DUF4864 domain-containing protein n=1 Tax=Chitiniphilus purpureus TaxID=2981137 RepID=A0ABY6DQM9_9NEIS|nr:hypothetical protein [Chitiniphilus sp. CD1]UXY16679.1 hypothetical protein N8I74_06570 [Chitiniphilus sp. CD1]
MSPQVGKPPFAVDWRSELDMRIISVMPILLVALGWGSSAAAAACAADFPGFISRFEDSPAFQRQHTRFPLTASRIDNSGVEGPREVVYTVKRHADQDYKWIAWPTRFAQAAIPLVRRIEQAPGGMQVVTFTKPDTDQLVTFYFERSGGCWSLVKFADFSL